ncbi:unnamed protein product, partial [Staurois parvus]
GDTDIVNAGVQGRPDIMNAGSRDTRYSEMQGPRRADIVNAETGRADKVNAGSKESRYSECRDRGDRI